MISTRIQAIPWEEDSICDMIENSCVAAFGDAKRFIEFVYFGHIVLLSHKRTGLVAIVGRLQAPDVDTYNRDVPYPKERRDRQGNAIQKGVRSNWKKFLLSKDY